MFGISQLRLAVYAVVALVFLTLSAVAAHYHSAWVDAKTQIATKQVELDGALAAAKACNDATEHLRKMADEKEESVKKAQEQASIVAKSNQAMANKILNMSPKDANRCVAAQMLLEDYKAQTQGGK